MIKNPLANAGDAGDMGSVPGLERSPGRGNGTPLQYSGLGNPTVRGAWRATVCGAAKSQIRLSMQEQATIKNVEVMKKRNWVLSS